MVSLTLLITFIVIVGKGRYRRIQKPLILSGLLLVYILIQLLNPSYEQKWQTGLRVWTLVPVAHLPWLPTSIQSTFSETSPSHFLIYSLAGIGMAQCIFLIKRPSTHRRLLQLISVNGFCIAIIALIQITLKSDNILGIFDAKGKGLTLFFGTFLYKNHAAAFFNLAIASCFACFLRARRHNVENTSPQRIFFLLFAGVIFVAIMLSNSRFGFLCALGVIALFIPIIYKVATRSSIQKLWIITTGIVCFMILTSVSFFLLKNTRASHLTTLTSQITEDFSFQQRMLAYEAELSMLRSKPIFGWGAGNFRHGFRKFQDLEAEKEAGRNLFMEQRSLNYFWQHAHNDYLEFLIELGIVGTLILFSIPGYFFWIIFRSRRWKDPVTLMLLAGLGSTLVHALIDFQFRNPAVLTTWFAILAIAAQRCSKSTHSHRSQAPNGSLSGDQGCGRESLHPEPAAPPRPPL